MTTSELTSQTRPALNSYRSAGLDQATDAIRAHQRSVLKDLVAIGSWLTKVKEQHLYLARYRTFREYLEREALVSHRLANLWMGWAVRWKVLEEDLEPHEMPANASHLTALDDLPENKRVEAWRIVLNRSKEERWPINAKIVRNIIRSNYLLPDPVPERVTENTVKTLKDARIRIADLCGDHLMRQIDLDMYHVPSHDLMLWARQDEERVIFIGRCVSELGWDVSRANLFYADKLSRKSSLTDIVNRAIAQGGPLKIKINGCLEIGRAHV